MKQTMKHQSLLSGIKSLGIMLSLGLVLASCTKDDVAQNPAKPNEEENKNLTTFVAGGENKTRTSMDYNSGDFYWEAGDYIYVKDDNGVLRKSTNAPTSKVASFNYKVPGKFTAKTSYKVYYLGKNSSGNSVTISTAQKQTAPNIIAHFNTAGDYGMAKANKVTGKNQFEFVLEHHPAYLVFQPYTSNTILQNCYLTKVEVSSDNDIVAKYTVNLTTDTLDASAVSNGKQIVLKTQDTSSSSSSYYNGFPLTNNSASVTTNGAYMVIKPGTHTLKVRYWVKDVVTKVEGTITKAYPSTAYASNTYYDMTADLNVRDYDGDHYYMWDAQEQYWKGHEWNHGGSQPTLNNDLPNATKSSDYAKNNSDPRYSHKGDGSVRFDATQSCATLPNANELSWYCMYGDPRWDADELWTTMGHLYKGGMWFKKKSVLLAEGHYDTEKSADGSTDLRTEWKFYDNYSRSINNSGLPSAAAAGNYFYLPALGYYLSDQLSFVGVYGCYWSSSAELQKAYIDPWTLIASPRGYSARYLSFSSGRVNVFNSLIDSPLKYGYRVGVFE
jgi:putative lipoprotein